MYELSVSIFIDIFCKIGTLDTLKIKNIRFLFLKLVLWTPKIGTLDTQNWYFGHQHIAKLLALVSLQKVVKTS